MMNHSAYHNPVLFQESIAGLVQDKNGIYVDATFGGGGHSRGVLSNLGEKGRLIGFDQDEDAQENIPEDERFQFIQANFRHLKNNLRFLGIRQVDGILADLGVSSHQFDVPERGFSFRSEARLDMRMAQGGKLTAYDVVNSYSEERLVQIFKEYGELKEAYKLANRIVYQRNISPIESTEDLVSRIESLSRDGKMNRFLAKVFQALRIEVNGEMEALEDLLSQSADVIKPGGNLVVISYHSLEDRMVKRYMKSGNQSGRLEKDFYGNPLRPFSPLKGMPIVPGPEEIEINNRARSAKLRIAKRNEQSEKK